MEQKGSTPKRILFVDDDPNVLSGLRNVLRSKRREWDMDFANGPEEALAKVAERSFDVVVSDMRMPRMDGATLLAKIKVLQPKAVRMILSGQTELESVMKSVFVAHMFLSKPCDPTVLRSVVDRACQLNAILNSDELRGAAGKVEMLPAAPKTYIALNEALCVPNCAITDVVRIIERDVGLCAKLLQLVNSAFFGLPRKIASLTEAVTYLGTVTIKNLAMALEAFASASGACGLSQAELLTLQDHSLLTGQIARQIQGGDKKKAEEAFLAGVLHEVGWLVKVSDAFSPDAGIDIDRALLGAYLLGLWGLPHTILEAVAYHQEPRLVAHSELEIIDVVYIANHLASEMRGASPAGKPLDLSYLASLGVDEERIAGMRALARKVAGVPDA
jgi:HD-like signal output (HDOD) protein